MYLVVYSTIKFLLHSIIEEEELLFNQGRGGDYSWYLPFYIAREDVSSNMDKNKKDRRNNKKRYIWYVGARARAATFRIFVCRELHT